MPLPMCKGFELSPVATASEQMPIARGAGDGSGAVADGVGAADVACSAKDGTEALTCGVRVAALEWV